MNVASVADVGSIVHALGNELSAIAFSADASAVLVGAGVAAVELAVRLGEAAILMVLVSLVAISLLDTFYRVVIRDERRPRPKR